MFIPDSDLFTHSGSRIQESKRHRIPDPQHPLRYHKLGTVQYELHYKIVFQVWLTLSAAKSMSSREAEAAMMILILVSLEMSYLMLASNSTLTSDKNPRNSVLRGRYISDLEPSFEKALKGIFYIFLKQKTWSLERKK
jgi:hypothetical protein